MRIISSDLQCSDSLLLCMKFILRAACCGAAACAFLNVGSYRSGRPNFRHFNAIKTQAEHFKAFSVQPIPNWLRNCISSTPPKERLSAGRKEVAGLDKNCKTQFVTKNVVKN